MIKKPGPRKKAIRRLNTEKNRRLAVILGNSPRNVLTGQDHYCSIKQVQSSLRPVEILAKLRPKAVKPRNGANQGNGRKSGKATMSDRAERGESRASVAGHAPSRASAPSRARKTSGMTRRVLLFAAALALSACEVGPDYVPALAPIPQNFKELRGRALKGFKLAAPRESVDAGPWWLVYRDPVLDSLERQVEISNQTVAAAAAAYEQARTLIRTAQAALFPTVTASYSVSRTYTGAALLGGSSTTTASGGAVASIGSGAATSLHGVTTTVQTTQAALTWDLDVWGKIRRQIESNVAGAQVSAADLINAKLTAQAQLAMAYFNLRAAYSLRSLLEKTAAEYKKTVTITQFQYKGGTVSEADLVAAETQYLSAQAAAISHQ